MNFREKRLLRGLSPSEIGYIRGLVVRKFVSVEELPSPEDIAMQNSHKEALN